MRILLVGCRDLFYEGIMRLAKDIGDDPELVHAQGSMEAIELASGAALDLALFDLDALDADPVGSIREFLGRFEKTPVIGLAHSEQADYARRVLEAGARGYIPKSSTAPVLLTAVKLVLLGGAYLPPLLLGELAQSGDPAEPARLTNPYAKRGAAPKEPAMTPRQLEVLCLVAKGESNKVIARRLGIADSTVKIHMRAIFQALEVKTRSQAAIAASRLDKVLNEKIRAALNGETSIAELLPSMTKRAFKQNQLLFRKGDPSQEIYYISRGTIYLEEIDADLQSGNLLGEIGLFTPNGQRTCTARCKTDAELLVIPAERALQIYCQDPEFAVYVTHLLAERLIADKARLEAA